jgi:Domain of unknown function (DUF929)
MVDWAWVDQKRADGWSWEEIAADRRSGFRADRAAPASAARQLRTLARARNAAPTPAPPERPATGPERRWGLARTGWLLFPFFGPWALLAFLLPSPVGVYLPLIPLLGLGTAAAGFLLGFGLLRAPHRWTPVFRRTATIGAVASLVVAGGLGGAAIAAGCPVLSPFLTGEPGGWQRVPQGLWQDAGRPVMFFYGSVACPYCSATSWAVLAALERLGNVSQLRTDHSSPSDAYPNTASVVLSDLVVESPYVATDLREALDDQQIHAPALGSCREQAYVSAYNALGGVPFVVLGGTFVHGGTLVDPGALSGLNASTLEQQLAGHQGSGYAAIAPGTAYLLAYLVWLNGDRPASVADDPSVAPILGGIH